MKYKIKYKDLINRLKPFADNEIVMVDSDGRVYELIDDDGADECQRCALLKMCEDYNGGLCVLLFENVINKRFKER